MQQAWDDNYKQKIFFAKIIAKNKKVHRCKIYHQKCLHENSKKKIFSKKRFLCKYFILKFVNILTTIPLTILIIEYQICKL